MKITLLFFANLKEITKTGIFEIDIQVGDSINELKENLITIFPALSLVLE